jgi:hypothetical protein
MTEFLRRGTDLSERVGPALQQYNDHSIGTIFEGMLRRGRGKRKEEGGRRVEGGRWNEKGGERRGRGRGEEG